VTKADHGPARHERPVIDEAALAAARDAERLLDAARARGATTWEEYLSPVPGQLRDAGLFELRRIAQRARAAYGPRASIRDVLPAELTEPFLADLDRLIKALARDSMER
jgi:hypothetical protein